MPEQGSGRIVREVFVVVIAAVISILATLAFSQGDYVTRPVVEQMVTKSENRTVAALAEVKANQKEMLKMLQQVQIDMAKVAAEEGR